MKYFLFLITKEEFEKGNNGWKFVCDHEDRLVEYNPDVSDMDSFFTTMEREVFHVVKDNAVYHPFKNYLDLDNNRRIFVMVNRLRESDIPNIKEEVPEEGTNEEVNSAN